MVRKYFRTPKGVVYREETLDRFIKEARERDLELQQRPPAKSHLKRSRKNSRKKRRDRCKS